MENRFLQVHISDVVFFTLNPILFMNSLERIHFSTLISNTHTTLTHCRNKQLVQQTMEVSHRPDV